MNRLLWMQEFRPILPTDRVLQKTPSSFDVSVPEFFGPLLAGATLVLARPDGHRDPQYLAELIVGEGITRAHFVPSMLELFLDEPTASACTGLRVVAASGEALPLPVARRFADVLPGAVLDNLYGPTEAAVEVSYAAAVQALPADAATVPIGWPSPTPRSTCSIRTCSRSPMDPRASSISRARSWPAATSAVRGRARTVSSPTRSGRPALACIAPATSCDGTPTAPSNTWAVPTTR